MKKFFLVSLFCVIASALMAQTKTEVRDSDLQKPIVDYMTKNCLGCKIDKAFKVDSKGTITYDLCVSKGRERSKISFDKDGKFLLKEPCVCDCCKEANKSTSK